MRQECLGPSLGARDARKILARRRFERSPSKGLKSRCRAQRRHEAPLSDEPNMIESLAQKKCTPCRGGIPPLTHDEAERFRSQTPNWELRDDSHHAANIGDGNGYRYREVVQPDKGIWIYSAFWRRWQRCVRPYLGC